MSFRYALFYYVRIRTEYRGVYHPIGVSISNAVKVAVTGNETVTQAYCNLWVQVDTDLIFNRTALTRNSRRPGDHFYKLWDR